MKLNDIAGVFGTLRNDAVKIGTLNETYENGVDFHAERELVCDLQPYNEAVEQNGFGQSLKGGMKMYFSASDPLKEGDGVEFDGRIYRAVQVSRCKSHKRALLEFEGVMEW